MDVQVWSPRLLFLLDVQPVAVVFNYYDVMYCDLCNR